MKTVFIIYTFSEWYVFVNCELIVKFFEGSATGFRYVLQWLGIPHVFMSAKNTDEARAIARQLAMLKQKRDGGN